MRFVSPSSSWSALLTTNLRVLIDEAVTDPLARELMKASCLNALYVRDIPTLVEASDEAVMAFAQEHDRLLLTSETWIKERPFRFCSHTGKTILCTIERPESLQPNVFQ